MTTDQRREELLRWIAQTRRNQRVLGIIIAGAVALSLVLMLWRGEVGGILLAITVFSGIAGFWITGGHLIDWKGQLANLDKPRPVRVAGGGRRF